MKKKLTNQQKIDLILEDLEGWLCNGDDYSSIRFAFENGYYLHAASLWMSSGAMSEELQDKVFPVKINHKKEMKEVKMLLEEAVVFVCPDCNSHHYLNRGDFNSEGKTIDCEGCNKTAYKQIKKLLKVLRSGK